MKSKQNVPRPSLTLAAECALIEKAQAGDKAAMEQIFLQYHPLVLAAGHQRRVKTFAEDATAAAEEELLRSIHAFDTTRGTPFAAFVKVRVYGAVSHLFTRTTRTWERECAANESDALESIADKDAFTEVETKLQLAPLLSVLSEKERRVIEQTYLKDQTARAAAPVLGLSQSSVERIKRQALAKMRAAVHEKNVTVHTPT